LRKVKAWAAANPVPVIYCKTGEAKHLIGEEHMRAHPPTGPEVFLILAGKARAPVWKARRRCSLVHLDRRCEHVYH
jgi:hypothetical protein